MAYTFVERKYGEKVKNAQAFDEIIDSGELEHWANDSDTYEITEEAFGKFYELVISGKIHLSDIAREVAMQMKEQFKNNSVIFVERT